MPKQQPVERFRVTTFVPKELLGEVMSSLTRIGLSDVNFDLVTDIPRFQKNNTDTHETKSTEFLTEWTKEHPTFKSIEAVKAFDAVGRSKGACYPAITTLVEKGVLVKLGPGEYSRADVKHLPAPKTTAPAKHDITNADFIIRAARRSGGRFNRTSLRKLFEADGRTPSSVSPTINSLLDDKRAKRVGEGQYILLSKAAKKTKPKPKAKAAAPPPAALNGSEAGVSNG